MYNVQDCSVLLITFRPVRCECWHVTNTWTTSISL